LFCRWYLHINIGTPPQTMHMLPDSGANDFEVESTLLPPQDQESPWLFNPNASSTAHQVPGYSYSEGYDSGFNDSGVVFTDVVSFGGVAFNGLPFMVETQNNDNSPPYQTGNLGLNLDPLQSTTPHNLPSFMYILKPYLNRESSFTRFCPKLYRCIHR
jgi:hypothetical protein